MGLRDLDFGMAISDTQVRTYVLDKGLRRLRRKRNVLRHGIHVKICLIEVIFGPLARQTLWIPKVRLTYSGEKWNPVRLTGS
jgi:hypothetical protein